MRTGPDRTAQTSSRDHWPFDSLLSGAGRIAERTTRHVMAVRDLLLACFHDTVLMLP